MSYHTLKYDLLYRTVYSYMDVLQRFFFFLANHLLNQFLFLHSNGNF